MAQEENINNRLTELTGSDYEIVDGEPDIRGWDVQDEQGRMIGEVIELLFDPSSQRVHYIVVDVDYENQAAELEKQIMIPIRIAEFRPEKGNDSSARIVDDSDHPENIPFHDGTNTLCDSGIVVVPISLRQIMDLPSYDPDRVNSGTELAVHKVFESSLKEHIEGEGWQSGGRVSPKRM